MGKFRDIKEYEFYTEDMDSVVYYIVSEGQCSCAKVQMLVDGNYAKASRVIDLLKEYGYIDEKQIPIITETEFQEIVKNRK